MTDVITGFLQSFMQICPEIKEEELNFLRKQVSVSTYHKKSLYLSPKAVQKSIGFIGAGLIRTYYMDENGKDITLAFNKEGDYVTDYLAFIKQAHTNYYFECLEDCTVVNLPYVAIRDGYNRFKVFEKYGRLIAEKVLEVRIKRVDSFLFHNAEDRYLEFVSENPGLLNRIAVTHLCSFLGTERQTLTRIRKKIAMRKE